MKGKDLLRELAKELDKRVEHHLKMQVTDAASPSFGGLYTEDAGFASACNGHTASVIHDCGYAYFCRASRYYQDVQIPGRIAIAAAYIKSQLRPSGFVDLRDRNYDSPPDTAFVVCAIAPVWWMAQQAGSAEIAGVLAPMIEAFGDALADHGGFHTPNHRWIICGALACAWEVTPKEAYLTEMRRYLGETIDLNADGLYSEKSFHYSAAINTKLFLVYDVSEEGFLLEAIAKNADCMIALMNRDTTFLTHISIRQDNGLKVRPDGFLAIFLRLYAETGEERYRETAARIAKAAGVTDTELVYLYARHPEAEKIELPEDIPPPADREVWMKESGIWRWRQGAIDVSAMEGKEGALSVQYGDVNLAQVRIYAPYFAGARYFSRELEPTEVGVRMEFRPIYGLEQELLMPGYWEPMGVPVPFDDLPYNNLDKRKRIPRPDIAYRCELVKRENGFDLKLRSVGGLTHVPFTLSFLFQLPALLATECTFEKVEDTRMLQLTRGYLGVRVGTHMLSVGPGFCEHTLVEPLESCLGFLRVSLSCFTPVDRTVEVRVKGLAGMAPEEYRRPKERGC